MVKELTGGIAVTGCFTLMLSGRLIGHTYPYIAVEFQGASKITCFTIGPKTDTIAAFPVLTAFIESISNVSSLSSHKDTSEEF